MSRLEALKNYMKKHNISAVVIPTADMHLSEYISDHFKLREYLSGFTGSAGTLVVTECDAGLWTDGRYYLQAEKELSGVLGEIKDFADAKLRELGYNRQTEVTLTEEWYDTREYESFTLPCGYYTALRVIIGEGEGQNWWCVMFPPLCLDVATAPSSYTAEEEILISKKYNVKFKILELVSEFAR